MINDGQVYLAGYVASQPAFKFAGGKPTATVRVAFTPRWLSRETGEWADGPTSFVNVLCWRTLATNVAMSLHKGEPVLVMGRLRVRRYEDKEGAPRLAVEVEANSIGHDLSRGVAAFSRLRRPPAEAAAETADGMAAIAELARARAAASGDGVVEAAAGSPPAAGAPEDGLLDDGAPEDRAPDDGAPEDGAPEDGAVAEIAGTTDGELVAAAAL